MPSSPSSRSVSPGTSMVNPDRALRIKSFLVTILMLVGIPWCPTRPGLPKFVFFDNGAEGQTQVSNKWRGQSKVNLDGRFPPETVCDTAILAPEHPVLQTHPQLSAPWHWGWPGPRYQDYGNTGGPLRTSPHKDNKADPRSIKSSETLGWIDKPVTFL